MTLQVPPAPVIGTVTAWFVHVDETTTASEPLTAAKPTSPIVVASDLVGWLAGAG